MTCLVSVVGEAHYMGSTKDSAVPLNLTPVDKITRVYDKDQSGEVSRVYVEGRDYRLYNNTVDWGPTGDDTIEPARGATFYVDYVYNKTMVKGQDYDIMNRLIQLMLSSLTVAISLMRTQDSTSHTSTPSHVVIYCYFSLMVLLRL